MIRPTNTLHFVRRFVRAGFLDVWKPDACFFFCQVEQILLIGYDCESKKLLRTPESILVPIPWKSAGTIYTKSHSSQKIWKSYKTDRRTTHTSRNRQRAQRIP